MNTKIHFSQGDTIFDVEGDADVVREVYRDIKDSLISRLAMVKPARHEPTAPEAEEEAAAPDTKRKRTTRKKRAAPSSAGEQRAEPYQPSLVKDLSLPGLQEFYNKYSPKSHVEKVLMFVHFLKEAGHDPCTADEIFTCYKLVNIARPKVFKQAIIDAHGSRFGYVDYQGVDNITVTTIGEDHLNFKMTKSS